MTELTKEELELLRDLDKALGLAAALGPEQLREVAAVRGSWLSPSNPSCGRSPPQTIRKWKVAKIISTRR
jgi:hypothetical protein